MKKGADFENDHLIFNRVRKTAAYKNLVRSIKKCRKIFLIGNGGLMDVSAHAAADLSRLIPGKAFYAFNSPGFMTSNANDHGFDSMFVKWLEITVDKIEDPATTLLIGLSCSGNSPNVLNALRWAAHRGYNTFLISGAPTRDELKKVPKLCFGCKNFHTTEVLTMKLFYDIVYKTGNHCPDIAGEVKRKWH